jgi:acyl-CoA thioesterase-1
VLKEDVRILIIALGANDGLRGLSVSQMRENLSQMIASARERGIAVILAGMEAPPNYGPEYAVAFRDAYASLAREHKITFVPFLLAGVAGHPALNQADGIHPTAEGQTIVAETIWQALHPILDQIANS